MYLQNNETNKLTLTSSLDTDNFIVGEEEIKDYSCAICTQIPNPNYCFEAVCCGRLFCKSCIEEWVKKNHNCPLCRGVLETNGPNLKDIKEKNKIIYRLLKNLQVKCPNDCGWKGTWDTLEKHSTECKLKKNFCKYKNIGCQFQGFPDQLMIHENNCDKEHLQMAMRKIKELNKNISNKCSIQFDLGEEIYVSCHPHPLVFMNSKSWTCDGKKLGGCLSKNPHHQIISRFRCKNCDFDLCNNCAFKYIQNK